MTEDEDLKKRFDEDWVAKFQQMQEERIEREHADDAAKLQKLKEEEDFRISAAGRASEAVQVMLDEHKKRVAKRIQPMHDALIEMGAQCKCNHHRGYDYYE